MGGPGGPGKGAPGGSDPRRVIIRVTATGASAVELTASGEGAAPLVVTLNDAGTVPDMRAGDDDFAGDGLLPADSVAVRVTVDGTPLDAGVVSWEPTETLRVLEVKVDGGQAIAKAAVGEKKEKKAMAGAAAPRAGGSAPGAAGVPPTGGAAAVGGVGEAGADGGWQGVVFPVAVLVGLVAAGAIIGLLPRRGAGSGAPPGLVPVPAGGILGPNTPAFTDSPRLWGVAPEERTRFLGVLIDALARHHAVIVAIADGEPIPSPAGGAVFRSSATPKVVLGSALGLSQPGRPPVVLVVPPAGDLGTGWPARAPGCELLVLAAPLTEGMDVVVQRDGTAWRVRSRQGDARIG